MVTNLAYERTMRRQRVVELLHSLWQLTKPFKLLRVDKAIQVVS